MEIKEYKENLKNKISHILNLSKTVKSRGINLYTFYEYYLSNSYEKISLYNGSFGNCQNFTINCFYKLLNVIENYEDLSNVLKYFNLQFDNRKILVADIREKDFDILKTITNGHEEIFIIINKYISTNKSKMVLIMIDITKL